MTENKEILPLTEEEIKDEGKKYYIPDEKGMIDFTKGACWALDYSYGVWKQRLLSEVEKAFKAGSKTLYERDKINLNLGEYMEQLKKEL